MTSYHRLALLACLALVAGSASAQDDIFGDASGLFGAPAGAAQPAASEEEEIEDPLVRQLLEHAGRGNLQLADSIARLIRLDRWTEADRLLARTAGMNIDDATLAEMFRRIGPTLYLRVKGKADLSGSAQAGMDKLASAANKYAESEDRLRSAIDQLGSASNDQQLEATRTLMSGGNPAIQALIAAAVSNQPAAKRDNILRILLALGGGGVDGLRQLALYGTPEVRAGALASLARISRHDHVVDLATALHATDANPTERQIALAQLQKIDGATTREASIQALAFDLQDKHQLAQRTENDDQIVTLWSVNEDRNGVTHQTAYAIHSRYRDAYDAAARLHRVGGLSPELGAATLAVSMGYHLLIDPDWGDPSQMQPIRDQYRDQLTGEAFSNVVARALNSNDHAATVGLVRLIDPATIADADRFALLHGTAGVAAPLVQAAWSPEPRVRYEAALKVAALAGETPYAGSSQVMRTLSEMVSLSDEPTVILVETRPEVILPIESFLSGLGLQVEVARTVGQAQRLVARGGDLRLIIAKSDLADLPAIELIDSVRRMNRGRQLPIAIFGDQAPFLGEPRWSAPTTWIEGQASLVAIDEIFDLVKRSRRMPPLTVIDRQDYRQSAAALLGLGDSN